MSESLAIVPTESVEEAEVIECFREASREVDSTVQVSLAKRIVRRGSNRVMCLAARTSVPMNNDDEASVSDLALKLSDGTNVRLSLSFFNDADQPQVTDVTPLVASPKAIPLTRSSYDPSRYRYAVASESNLGAVLLAIAFVVLAGSYALMKGQHGSNSFSIPTAKSLIATVDKVLHRPAATTTVRPAPTFTLAASPAALSPKSVTLDATKPVLKSVSGKSVQTHKVKLGTARLKAQRAPRAGRKSFFVPPPPIAYIPPPPPTMPFDPLQMISPAAIPTTPIEAPLASKPAQTATPAEKSPTVAAAKKSSAEATATKSTAITTAKKSPSATESRASANSKTSARALPKSEPPASGSKRIETVANRLPEVKKTLSTGKHQEAHSESAPNYASHINTVGPKLERPSSPAPSSTATHKSAPLPGIDLTPPAPESGVTAI